MGYTESSDLIDLIDGTMCTGSKSAVSMFETCFISKRPRVPCFPSLEGTLLLSTELYSQLRRRNVAGRSTPVRLRDVENGVFGLWLRLQLLLHIQTAMVFYLTLMMRPVPW